ncbi:MAG: hypothetical protein LBH98_03200, partial [Chitinispirillales bacterium]|nr:hypothetical protein [Chitinispirillales bacterium]
MQTIKLKNILNQEDKEYFSEICVHLGYDNQEVSSFLPANLRCRMLFDCLVDFRKKNEDGSEGPWERGQENISIVIPSASEMIDLILGRTDEAYPSNLTVSVDLWKSLLYYCQVFLGVMKNSPIQFSLSNADSASKNFDRFEEYLNWIVSGGDDDKGERGMAVISTHLNSTDVY